MLKERLLGLRRTHGERVRWFTLVLPVLVLLVAMTGCEVEPTPTVSPIATPSTGVVVAGPAATPRAEEGELPFLDDMEIGGVAIVGLIILIVHILKEWAGVPGKYLRWVSLGLGFAFGILYQYGMGWPTTPQGWMVFVVRLCYGVLSSGLIDLARDLISRVNCK